MRHLYSGLAILLILFFTGICVDPSANGGTGMPVAPMGGVKVKLVDLPVRDDGDSGETEHTKGIKAILVNLNKINVYSSTRGWVEAVNLVSDAYPNGSFFELIGAKGATPELGFFQLEKDDYSRVRFYFGSKNYVIAKDHQGVLRDYPLHMDWGEHRQGDENKDHSNYYAHASKNKNSGNKGNSAPDRTNSAAEQKDDPSKKQENKNEENGENEEENYMEFLVNGGFSINPESVIEVTVGVNPLASVHHDEEQGYNFHPVMKVTDVKTVAGASGLIRAATGGRISIANDVTIDIPPGALPRDTNVAIIPKQKPAPGDYRPEFIDLKNYVFLSHNLTMNSMATLTVHIDPDSINDINAVSGNDMLSEDFLDIQYFDTTQKRYRSVGRTMDFNSHTVVAQINHFSTWAAVLNTAAILGAFYIVNGIVSMPIDIISWQTRVNVILHLGCDWNTTSVVTPQPVSPVSCGGIPMYNFDSLRAKNAAGKFVYITKVIDKKTNLYETTTPETDFKGKDLLRPKYIDSVEVAWSKNNEEYTPGYPMNPLLFMISQSTTPVWAQDGPTWLNSDVPGYASVYYLSEMYSDVTLGAYLFYHVAQRHDLCDSEGGTYNKTYDECNLDFYGHKASPESVKRDSAGKLLFPAKFPSFYNAASICHSMKNGPVKDRCWMMREAFMTAISAGGIIADKGAHYGSHIGGTCDDYDLAFVDDALIQTGVPVSIRATGVFNLPNGTSETRVLRTWICSGNTPDAGKMLDYLASHDYPELAGIGAVVKDGKLPGVTFLRSSKTCSFLNSWVVLNWQLDPGWESLAHPTTPAGFIDWLQNLHMNPWLYEAKWIKVYRDNNPRGQTSLKSLSAFLISLITGGYFQIPADALLDNNAFNEYFWATSTKIDPPNAVPWWPYGNYHFSVQPTVQIYPGHDYSRPPFNFLKADAGDIMNPAFWQMIAPDVAPSTFVRGVDYCNHELGNYCWDTNTSCPP
ncbi:MAG: hypothetical protein OEV66_03660 [Spirochaetia bacterium]|nr:hypothetical protein [Spirochaetia bacterium]